MKSLFQAKHIIDTYWDGSIPVNYYAICEKMNVSVEKTELSSLGFLEKSGNDIKIYINKDTDKDNIVIAFFFSKICVGLNDGGYSVDTNDFNTSISNIHNSIALHNLHYYLVPKFVMHSILKDGYKSLEELAKTFNISETLMLKAIECYK